MIFDAYGREIDTGLLKREQAFPTLAGIRNVFSSLWPSVGLTPEKLTGILRASDYGDPFLYLELAEEMEEKDTHYLSVLNKRKGAVSSLELLVEAASKDPADEKIADFIRDVLVSESGLSLSEHLFDIMDALGKGFSATEIEWDTEKRLKGDLWWVPKQLHWRDPRWFMFDWISGRQVLVRTLHSTGETIELAKAATGHWQMTNGAGQVRTTKDGGQHLDRNFRWNDEAAKIGIQPMTEPLIPYKFIVHFGHAKAGLPVRAGLARCLAYIYLFKNYAFKDWTGFTSRYGQPLRMGKYDTGANAEDKAALYAAVANIGTDMSGIIPKAMEVVFESPATLGSSLDIYRTFMTYLDDLESKLVLGSTLGTETRGEGSRAAAQVHRDVERDIMESDVKRLEATLNRDLVRPLVDLNFGPPKDGHPYPRLRIGLPDTDDVNNWIDSVTKLAESGMKIGVKNIYEKLHLTPPEDDEAVLTPPERVTVTDDQGNGNGNGKPKPSNGNGKPSPKAGDEEPPTGDETEKPGAVHVGAREDPHGAVDD